MGYESDSLLLRPWVIDDVAQLDGLNAMDMSVTWQRQTIVDCFSDHYFGWVICDHSDPFHHHVVAYLVALIEARECQLLNLLVGNDYRRLGCARRLIQQMVTQAARASATKIFLEVNVTNQPAITLYKSCGFERVGLRKAYYKTATGREDALIFCRTV